MEPKFTTYIEVSDREILKHYETMHGRCIYFILLSQTFVKKQRKKLDQRKLLQNDKKIVVNQFVLQRFRC
jgi:hypothetical protein